MFRMQGAELEDVPKLLRIEELDAFEYSAVRWGPVPQINRDKAEAFRDAARKNDILVSMHGSYFINFLGDDAIVEASKRRLVASATAAEWMGAYVVVFHVGFYGELGTTQTMHKCVQTIREVQATLTSQGIEKVKLGPEVMGKHTAFGSLDEILSICQQVEGTQLVIDWAHLHARSGGRLRTVEDFRNVVAKAENALGIERVREMHCHFSKIEYTYKSGERRHHILSEPGFGPEFEPLAEVIAEFKLNPTIICETLVQDIDAMKMRKVFQRVITNRAKIEEAKGG